MRRKSFFTNKYTLSVIILLLCLVADILLHKGMSRVILPESFTELRKPQQIKPLNIPLIITGKKWHKGVNTIARFQALEAPIDGFEMDVYFDTSKNYLQVYHDSTDYSELTIVSILEQYKAIHSTASIWLDFKNLSANNQEQSLAYLTKLREKYSLQNRLIIESSFPEFLQAFSDNGFYTSYYTPFFNPYQLADTMLVKNIDSISTALNNYKVCALSGYYFQYPVLKKYFPNFPILTWTDNSRTSVVTNAFNYSLLNDDHVKVVLFP